MSHKPLRKHLPALIVGTIVGLIFSFLMIRGDLNDLEWMVDDALMRRGVRTELASDDIAVVLLDQASLDWAEDELGLSWPWPREMYGYLTNFISSGGALALGFDVIYSEASVYGVYDDLEYKYALEDFGNAVGVVFLSDDYGSGTWPENVSFAKSIDQDFDLTEYPYAQFPIPEFAGSYSILSNVQVHPDNDGLFRRVPPVSGFDGKVVPSMALALYQLGGTGDGVVHRENGRTYLDGKRIRSDKHGNLVLRFRGPTGTHKTYNAAEVIRSQIQIYEGNEPQLDPGAFNGKYVLFGFSAPGLKDIRPTPMGPDYSGVEIHATMLDNLLTNELYAPVLETGSGQAIILTLAILLYSILASLAVTSVQGSRNALRDSLLIFVGFLLLAILLTVPVYFLKIDLPVSPILGAGIFSMALAFIVNSVTEGKNRRFLKSAFGHYVSPYVVDQLVADPDMLKPGGERKELTMFFSDLQGFTSISENIEPEQLTDLLNDYLDLMCEVILQENGTIDKFEGDAIIAFWNAPTNVEDHAASGVRAVLRCQEVLARERPRLEEKSAGKPMLMRVGMNTGQVTVGNMGSSDRFDYSMLGDAVNLAARLEGVNKQFGTFSMISKATLDAARAGGEDFPARELGRVRVVGKTEPITVFEPMTKAMWANGIELWRSFADALVLLYDGDFPGARAGFATLAQQDPAAAKYVVFIDSKDGRAPDGWDGVLEMTSK